MTFSAVRTAFLALLVPAARVLGTFVASGAIKPGPIEDAFTVTARGSTHGNGTNGWGTFDQLLDHANASLGTFPQWYWYETQYWKGPGSPIILFLPGEQPAYRFTTFFTTRRLTGVLAQEMGAAILILEHRYFGNSSPFDQLTVQNLQYLTLENSIKDLTYFANSFEHPYDCSGKSRPNKAPWIVLGGSYPGALVGWVEALDPGTFWAYLGSSAIVQAIGDFWQYFTPVQEATPANCSRDISAVIEHVDSVLLNGSTDDKMQLKNAFKLGDLADADFAAALWCAPALWQESELHDVLDKKNKPNGNLYYHFCDYVENMWPSSNNPVPDAQGVGLAKALDGYAKWFSESYLPGKCQVYGYEDEKWNDTLSVGCLQNTDPNNLQYYDLRYNNTAGRQWLWMVCNNPMEFWQDAPPIGQPTLVSRLVTRDYWKQQCDLYFPLSEGGSSVSKGKTADDFNRLTGGWSRTNTTRLMYTNGRLDPWRDSTVSSINRPGGPLQSTPQLPVRVAKDGIHNSDFYADNWELNADLKSVVDDTVQTLKQWVGEFYQSNKA